MPGWFNDLVIGMRIAVLAGRKPRSIVVRLSLATVGVGLLVAALLLGSSLYPALQDRADRLAARQPVSAGTGGQTVDVLQNLMRYRDTTIKAVYLEPNGPDAPVPPGLAELPAPGEAVVSPALAELLRSEQGEMLRPRIGERVTGVIGREGVADQHELSFYVGAQDIAGESSRRGVEVADGFGAAVSPSPVSAEHLLFVVPATGLLVVPLLIFISTTSRVSGAERERRLSALRLGGASARQVRRIAAAEPMVGLLTGGIVGIGLYLLARPAVGGMAFGGEGVYSSDLVPPWPLAVLVAILVPALTIGAAWIGMRGTIVEPLGVLRRSTPPRRKLWWRLLIFLLGVVLMAPDLIGLGTTNQVAALSVGLGGVLLVIGVPALLPWVTERVVARVRGGRPSWQLAVRRLQLDTGTPTRVIAGVTVVLAVVIAFHSQFNALQTDEHAERGEAYAASVSVRDNGGGLPDGVADLVRTVDGVQATHQFHRASFSGANSDYVRAVVAPCGLLTRYYQVDGCADGDVFPVAGGPPAGAVLTESDRTDSGELVSGSRFTVPAQATTAHAIAATERTATVSRLRADLLITSAAAEQLRPPDSLLFHVAFDDRHPDGLEQLRNALVPVQWQASAHAVSGFDRPSLDGGTVSQFKKILYVGAGLTMLLAGVSLLVAATQQVAERRRALAAMSASGVPAGTLARSLLWQNGLTVLFGVAIATGVGLLTGYLALRMAEEEFTVDWSLIGGLAGGAVLLVLLVTAGTMPALRAATRLEALRAE